MLYQKRKTLPFLQSQLLLDHGFEKHAFFLKGAPDFTFDQTHIATCSDLVKQTFSLDHIMYMNQVHGTAIMEVVGSTSIPEADGLVTKQVGCGLLVRHADCQAALIVDPKKRVVVALHIGWRASAVNFFQVAFDHLTKHYRSKPSDCLVAISASLGPIHAEFKGYERYFPTSFLPMMVKPNYFDLWAVSTSQLTALGVKPCHIDLAKVCTYAEHEQCYSYRRGDKVKRMGSFIVL